MCESKCAHLILTVFFKPVSYGALHPEQFITKHLHLGVCAGESADNSKNGGSIFVQGVIFVCLFST